MGEEAKPDAPWEGELQERSLQCAVCIDFLCAPLTLGCGHTFCRLCLVQASRLATTGQQCPQCRAPVELKDLASHPVSKTVEAQVRALVPEAVLAAREASDAQKLKALSAQRRHRLPIFYMSGIASEPGQVVRLNLFESRYKLLARRAASGSRLFICTQREPSTGDVGLIVRIGQVAFQDGGRAQVSGLGVRGAILLSVSVEPGTGGLYHAEVAAAEAAEGSQAAEEALADSPVAPPSQREVRELPVFYMSRGALVGEAVRLKLFEPRYRTLARQAWNSQSRLFAFASNPPRPGDTAVVVRMQSCRWDCEGNAHIHGVGISPARMEDVREDAGRLFYARCQLPSPAPYPANGAAAGLSMFDASETGELSPRGGFAPPSPGAQGCCALQ
mmetsp:Transcript_157883/g.483824  ORF Transcript_157883/g.483824 Transcript_157883/m.483824 type:complete len:388 (+) Transcript_157883:37-1200(+)|eukprot:CAMPEP_0204569106 /NCGR_PEP_ID=MMETSP0661-20131031/37560_1 /ASSEMBLY_ACC=CAM_ASM_000606 /TAXON_ID=109239 /ORGANISM="Alexandrium margalefi, Strain AMGDE01CS-322" /LENGTH=387 /DNA_ID=CAMNT_0051577183 /DNA_START=27 /DNA_END=1190 /DNA_ORIENTATION=+